MHTQEFCSDNDLVKHSSVYPEMSACIAKLLQKVSCVEDASCFLVTALPDFESFTVKDSINVLLLLTFGDIV